MGGFLVQTLNGVTFAGLLFLLASGFTLIFGLMRIVNLAHGTVYLVGGLVGYDAWVFTRSYALAIVAGAVSMAIFGIFLERVLLRPLRGQPVRELLLTLGVTFVMSDLTTTIFGGNPLSIRPPSFIDGSTQLGSVNYPTFRLAFLAVGVAIAVALYVINARTRIGMIIRAGVDDREMVAALGIPVARVFTAVFVVGCLLAGAAGVLGASFLTIYPGVDSQVLLYALVVVIVGGVGSLKGAVVGSLVVSLLVNYASAYFPSFSYFSLFGPMVLILLWRPHGLFGRTVY